MTPKLSSAQLCFFFEQLSNMQEGGISILNSLKSLGEHGHPKSVARLAQTLALQIQTGETFSQALAGHPHIFSPLMVHLIQAGEASGKIETLCLENARILSRNIETKRALIQKAAYPLLILLSSLFLLPLPHLIAPSDLTPSQKLHTYLLHNVYPLAAGFTALLFAQDIPRGTLQKLKSMLFHLPLIGRPLKNRDVAQFLQTFALCQDAGIRADSAAKLAVETLSCQKTKRKLQDLPQRILQGEAPSTILASKKILSWDHLSLIVTGEKSGRSAENLLLAARELEKKSLHSLSIYLQLSGPVLLLIVGAIIGLQIAKTLANTLSQLQG
jgi:type II secretory pathway component PulF